MSARTNRIIWLVGLVSVGAASALAASGDLTQPAGKSGCISDDGGGSCAEGHALEGGVTSVAISPGGKSVYATTLSGVVRFERQRRSGAIVQPPGRNGCVSQDGSGRCADGSALKGGADSVVVSPDGRYLYVASYPNNAVGVFKRNRKTGVISQRSGAKGCVSQDGSGPCARGHGLEGVAWLVMSADGKSVYGASTVSNAIVVFNRNKATGALTQPAGAGGCVSDGGTDGCAEGHSLVDPVSIAASADGKNLYVASLKSNAVAILNRDPATGAVAQPSGADGCISADAGSGCAVGRALVGPFSVAVSDDGRSVYAASPDNNALARFDRDASTGSLSQPVGAAGCISEDGSNQCADGHGLAGANAVAVSPDGANVYVVGANSVVSLDRDPATGALDEQADSAACVSEDGSGPCADGHALSGGYGVAVSRDGKTVYTVSLDSAAIARFARHP